MEPLRSLHDLAVTAGLHRRGLYIPPSGENVSIKPFSPASAKRALDVLQRPRQALRNYLRTLNVDLREIDREFQEMGRAYFGADMEIVKDGEHVAFIEDEWKTYWDRGPFPAEGAQIPAERRLKTTKSDLFIQVNRDGSSIWVAPTSVVAASRVIKIYPSNREEPENFYLVTEDVTDTYAALKDGRLYPINTRHEYLRKIVSNTPAMAEMRNSEECNSVVESR